MPMFARSSAGCITKRSDSIHRWTMQVLKKLPEFQTFGLSDTRFQGQPVENLFRTPPAFELMWQQQPLGPVLDTRLGSVCSQSVHCPYPRSCPVGVLRSGCYETRQKPVALCRQQLRRATPFRTLLGVSQRSRIDQK